MEEFLKKQITGPPFIRFPVKEYIECSKLMKSNNQALRLLQTCMNDNSSLWAEVDILRKALYKMKSKWRLEPVFRGTKQVLKCMTTLRSEKLLDTISTALNSVVGLDGKLLVPSRQYLEYLLVKIIGK
ncbi:hypothetical protein EB796_010220 [Bugula neritina]|uniref:Nucleolus and neural progenitor protein-like N-terminal domain-containing protein n=1 Tax=Bugula neritina TaxID=10212 RepID=A0A7J7JYM3_BUGNE|nr:hypothetical protein EB796_010220 [Bugula neritina]